MTKRLKIIRSQKIDTKILEGLEAGATITSICAADDMPTIRSFQRWCRDDQEFADQVLRSMTGGLLIQVHEIHDRQTEAVNRLMDDDDDLDPKTMQALATILRDQNHNKVALLTRLDKRFSEKSEVAVTGPMVIGWENANQTCPSCGHNMEDVTPALNTIQIDNVSHDF